MLMQRQSACESIGLSIGSKNNDECALMFAQGDNYGKKLLLNCETFHNSSRNTCVFHGLDYSYKAFYQPLTLNNISHIGIDNQYPLRCYHDFWKNSRD